jgi:outer membrane lipoprotein-sorting protein
MIRQISVFLRMGLLAVLASGAAVSSASATELIPEFTAWLAAAPEVRTWSADFVQIRTLKSLTQPLTTKGHVWFAAPGQFRWELGSPVQTIAVRNASEFAILYPRLKRVERMSLDAGQSGQWRDATALLEAGFPRSRTDLEAQYKVASQVINGRECEITLEPKSSTARRMIPQITITFDSQDRALLWTQLRFADGSTMRNEFSNRVRNPALPPHTFELEIPPDYNVVEPLKK